MVSPVAVPVCRVRSWLISRGLKSVWGHQPASVSLSKGFSMRHPETPWLSLLTSYLEQTVLGMSTSVSSFVKQIICVSTSEDGMGMSSWEQVRWSGASQEVVICAGLLVKMLSVESVDLVFKTTAPGWKEVCLSCFHRKQSGCNTHLCSLVLMFRMKTKKIPIL